MRLAKYQLIHRLTGFTVFAFLLFFATTGIVLNHAEQLQLGNRTIGSDWLLDWYGIAPVQPPLTYRAGNDWLTFIDTRLYINNRQLPLAADDLRGVVSIHGILIAASRDSLLLLTRAGGLIEKYSTVDGLPGEIRKIGKLDDDRFIISTADGYYASDIDIRTWRKIRDRAVLNNWSNPAELPAAYQQQILQLYRGTGLTLERVMLDLHSGRLLGPWKKIVVDAAAMLLIISAVSGVWMWYKKKKLMAGI